MVLEKADIEYFECRGRDETPKFWTRLGGYPSLERMRVLDVGCGHGNLCVDIASRGADMVLGIDINKRLIEFAKENISQNYPQLKNIRFEHHDTSSIYKNEFDIIVSKDSFEHILKPDDVLRDIKQGLKDGGKAYIGFGPLYNSPYGDHKRTEAGYPWGHLITPESSLIKKLNERHGKNIDNVYDLDLNKLSLSEYKRLFRESGLNILYFRVNVSNNTISKMFSLMVHIPFLKEYFSHNIYCILEK